MDQRSDQARQARAAARRRLIIALLTLIPLGLATKAYAGPAEAWVRQSAGGVVYVMFFAWLGAAIRPTRRVLGWACLGVFVGTCGIEVMQLWRHPTLEAIRATFVGRTLLGSSFAWLDLGHYAIGAIAGWVVGAGFIPRRYGSGA